MEAARPRDLEGIDRLAVASLKEWGPGRLQDKGLVVVAREVRDGRVVGFAMARREEPCVGHVLAIAVEPQRRGEGIGSMLLRRVGQEMAMRGAYRLALEVDAGDGVAQAFYQRHGFRPEGLERCAYRDGSDALLLARPL